MAVVTTKSEILLKDQKGYIESGKLIIEGIADTTDLVKILKLTTSIRDTEQSVYVSVSELLLAIKRCTLISE
ncbi:hypothetical protein [Flavobacterium sp.]|uniref:hypothetical protein n=1 Tax=Flavobacterium sp. TaxID=239 RepID=UPI002625E3C4|nr:hypothetical protein [Flavobacterium sp.]